MTFSSSVDALLEFYSTCISLLKTSKSKSGGDGAGAGAARDREQLRRSMRSDRAQVRRAYSSGLSESGSRFRKGDGKPFLPAHGTELRGGGVLEQQDRG